MTVKKNLVRESIIDDFKEAFEEIVNPSSRGVLAIVFKDISGIAREELADMTGETGGYYDEKGSDMLIVARSVRGVKNYLESIKTFDFTGQKVKQNQMEVFWLADDKISEKYHPKNLSYRYLKQNHKKVSLQFLRKQPFPDDPIANNSGFKKIKKRFTRKMQENMKNKNRKLRENKVLKEEISRENVQKAMQFINKNCKLEIDGNDPDEGEGKYGGEFTCELGEGPFLIGSEGNYDIYLKDPVFYGEFEAEVKIERDVPGTPPGEYRPTDPPTEERILQGVEIDDAGLEGVVFKLSSDKSENAPGDISLEDTDDYVNLEEYSESDLRNIAEKQFDSFKEMIEVEYAEEHNLDL